MKTKLLIILALPLAVASCSSIDGFIKQKEPTNPEEPKQKEILEPNLKFKEDGTFKILTYADCQDDDNVSEMMIEFIKDSIKYENPDLILFLGDNVVVDSYERFKVGAATLLDPLIKANVPFAYVYGNHDAEYGVSKEEQLEFYSSTGLCYTTDPNPEITGLGTCSIPIYGNDGNMKFNLWMVDSNMYDSVNGGYDYVHTDQLEYIHERNQQIEEIEGNKVSSLVFQHICVPEVYELLQEATFGLGIGEYNGKYYDLQFKKGVGSGYIGEKPCPPTYNNGEFTFFKNEGNCLGMFFGHDHTNNFVANYDGINLTQVGGMSFQSYGNKQGRGYGVIELNENNSNTYSYHNVKFTDYIEGAITDPNDKQTNKKLETFKKALFWVEMGDDITDFFKKIFGL